MQNTYYEASANGVQNPSWSADAAFPHSLAAILDIVANTLIKTAIEFRNIAAMFRIVVVILRNIAAVLDKYAAVFRN